MMLGKTVGFTAVAQNKKILEKREKIQENQTTPNWHSTEEKMSELNVLKPEIFENLVKVQLTLQAIENYIQDEDTSNQDVIREFEKNLIISLCHQNEDLIIETLNQLLDIEDVDIAIKQDGREHPLVEKIKIAAEKAKAQN